jgi:hypothetical protein
LEKILNREVELLAFPYGKYNQKVLQLSRWAGYKRVFSSLPIFNSYRLDKFITGRIDIFHNDWLIEFRLKLIGAYQWLPIAVFLKSKFCNLMRYILIARKL